MRFVYFYLMKKEPETIREVAPRHAEYWKRKMLPDYIGGPFGDRSGGLICFSAEDLSAAESLVAGDPFVLEDLLEVRWLKDWIED